MLRSVAGCAGSPGRSPTPRARPPTSASVEPGSIRKRHAIERRNLDAAIIEYDRQVAYVDQPGMTDLGARRARQHPSREVARDSVPVDQASPPQRQRRAGRDPTAALPSALCLRGGRSGPGTREVLTAPIRESGRPVSRRRARVSAVRAMAQDASGTLRKPTHDLRSPSSRGSVRSPRLTWRTSRRQGDSLRGGGKASVHSVRSR